jgi:hypothetical protein
MADQEQGVCIGDSLGHEEAGYDPLSIDQDADIPLDILLEVPEGIEPGFYSAGIRDILATSALLNKEMQSVIVALDVALRRQSGFKDWNSKQLVTYIDNLTSLKVLRDLVHLIGLGPYEEDILRHETTKLFGPPPQKAQKTAGNQQGSSVLASLQEALANSTTGAQEKQEHERHERKGPRRGPEAKDTKDKRTVAYRGR